MISPEIKARMAKVLALQGSSNPNEAANAVRKLEEMCRQYGITPSDLISASDYDETNDSPEVGIFLKGKRVSQGLQYLLQAIVKYFDGTQVWAHNDLGHGYQMEVFATKGNLIKIELYFDYLRNEAEQQCAAAKMVAASRGMSLQGFGFNFLRGFATSVRRRLEELKADKLKNGIMYIEGSDSALVLQERSKSDLAKANALCASHYPKLRTIFTTSSVGKGYSDGRAAGAAVSLNTQISGGRPKQLTGR